MFSIISQDGLKSLSFGSNSVIKWAIVQHPETGYWLLTVNRETFGRFKRKTTGTETLKKVLESFSSNTFLVFKIPDDFTT